jgi:hypothetical protein
MSRIPIKAVGCREIGDPNMPSSRRVDEILKNLWTVASHPEEGHSDWTSSEVTSRNREPGELSFSDSGFKEGGLDLLGKYDCNGGEVTIYVDSCRQAALEYEVDVDALIEIVLIHELTHLITHNGFETSEKTSDHFWEFTAQCGTYAYLKQNGNEKALEVFEQLSPRQPFIYQTWAGLRAVEGAVTGKSAKKKVIEIVTNIFSAIPKAPTKKDMYDDFSEYDE